MKCEYGVRTKGCQQTTRCPNTQTRTHSSGSLQHSFRRNEDTGANHRPNDQTDAAHQTHLTHAVKGKVEISHFKKSSIAYFQSHQVQLHTRIMLNPRRQTNIQQIRFDPSLKIKCYSQQKGRIQQSSVILSAEEGGGCLDSPLAECPPNFACEGTQGAVTLQDVLLHFSLLSRPQSTGSEEENNSPESQEQTPYLSSYCSSANTLNDASALYYRAFPLCATRVVQSQQKTNKPLSMHTDSLSLPLYRDLERGGGDCCQQVLLSILSIATVCFQSLSHDPVANREMGEDQGRAQTRRVCESMCASVCQCITSSAAERRAVAPVGLGVGSAGAGSLVDNCLLSLRSLPPALADADLERSHLLTPAACTPGAPERGRDEKSCAGEHRGTLEYHLNSFSEQRKTKQVKEPWRSWKQRTHSTHEATMSCTQAGPEENSTNTSLNCTTNDDLECKICYQRYNAHSRRPKILDCLHRVCARCLNKILDMGDGSSSITCPFCRHETQVSEFEVAGLPDDSNIMSRLAVRDKSWSSDNSKEVVLTPKSLSSNDSPSHDSNCLVITIMEVQRDQHRSSSQNTSSDYYGDQSPDSVSVGSNSGAVDQDALSKFCNHVPRVLVWLLGFFYFGSLPLGIYLLVIQRVTLGIVCVSLVPSSLTVCLVYGFCQCLCQGMCDCSNRG
ncbi:hypothetical protein DNTS_002488 [Danionella cerebrum]|uniref:E3 ubiquitin-protein ligase RNF182 n=1 Tax=Danionella cerebrum TaxID=2873325 RepID=A0A553PXK0_9TELE|nr:hypothetical protein DNTS_002488 [Danionella translucida]